MVLHREIDDLREKYDTLIADLGGDISKIKSLLDYHGSVEKIKILLKNSTSNNQDDEIIALIKEKYGSIEHMHKHLKETLENLSKKESELSNLYFAIGGRETLDDIRNLKDNHGSFSRISEKLQELDNLKKTSNPNYPQQEKLDFVLKLNKYGSYDDILSKLSNWDSTKEKLSSLNYENEIKTRELETLRETSSRQLNQLQSILMEIGGEETLKDIKHLKDNYGSFSKISEKLEEFEELKRSSTLDNQQEKLEFVSKLNKYGSPEDILLRLSNWDSNLEKLNRLNYENEMKSKELRGLEENSSKQINLLNEKLNSKNNKLQSLLMEIGGEEKLKEIKHLRDNYGSFDSIKSYLEELKVTKTEVTQIKEKMRLLDEENRTLKQKLEQEISNYQKILQRLGGEEELNFIEELKNTTPSFKYIKEQLDSIPSLKEKSKRMTEIEDYIGEETWVLDQLKDEMIARRKNIDTKEEEIGDNFLKLGEKFRNECYRMLEDIFPKHDPDAFLHVEKDRKDISAVFIVEENKRFEVVIECKAIEQYFRNSPIVLTPPLREKDIDSVQEQIKKADKQLSKQGSKKVKITVISIPDDRFSEYGIKEEVILSQTNRELERLVISKSSLRPILLSLKVLCKNFTPVLDFEKLVDTYSNPEYAEMISQIYSKIEEWSDVCEKLNKKKKTLDKEYRLFTNNFEKVNKFMMEWSDIINSHWDKASSWSNNPKLLSSSEEADVEIVEDIEELE